MAPDRVADLLAGMCAFQGYAQEFPCEQTVRTKAEYCTVCLAAYRLRAAADALRQSREAQGKIREAVKALEDAEHGDERGWVDDDTVERAKAALIHTVVKWVRYGKLPAPPRETPPDRSGT